MQNDRALMLLRISFWAGTIVDGFVAIQLLLPDFWAAFNGFTIHANSPELNDALGVGASLLIGWTALLLWADRKPVERRGVLLITAFPVILGVFINNLLGITSGLRTFQGTWLSLIVQIGLVILFLYSYRKSDKLVNKKA
jgi:hypothetical protein